MCKMVQIHRLNYQLISEVTNLNRSFFTLVSGKELSISSTSLVSRLEWNSYKEHLPIRHFRVKGKIWIDGERS